MIYKDFHAIGDSESTPYDRGELCLNCNEYWFDHDGWKCSNVKPILDGMRYTITDFSQYLSTDRYLTQSMKDSIVSNASNFASLSSLLRSWKDPIGISSIIMDELHVEPTHQTTKPTIDQWQAWAHNQPGDCACGIKKDSCDYHKNP